MKTRSILIRVPGNPFSLEALMPDAHSAGVAGALLEHGHDTQVWDLGTLDTFDRLFPAQHRGALERVADQALSDTPPAMATVIQSLFQRKTLDRAFSARCEELSRELAETVAAQRGLHFVGFALNTAEDAPLTLSVAQRLRAERPELRLIAFGPCADIYVTDDPKGAGVFDCVLVAEPELSFPLLAHSLNNRIAWATIPNLRYQVGDRWHETEKKGAEDLDSLALPAYHCEAYPALAGMHKLKLFTVEDSRGCACRCHACALPGEGLGLRLASPTRVHDILLEAGQEHGAKAFHLAGMGTTGSHARATANELMDGALDVEYSRSLSVGLTEPTVFPLLEASGCRSVWFRVDTGSQILLENYYGRGIEVSHVERVLRAAKGAGLFTGARFTFPCPGDDRHTEAETLRLIDRTRLDAVRVDLPEMSHRSTWRQYPGLFGFTFDSARLARQTSATRLRFPLPVRTWDPLPFRVGNLSAGQVLAAHEALSFELNRRNVLTCFPEVFSMVARFAQQPGDERGFARQLQHNLITGSVSSVATLLSRFNHAACTPAYANALRRHARLRIAAGD